MSMSTFPLNSPPQIGDPMPVPSYGEDSLPIFSVSASTFIEANPLNCLEAVLNSPDYHLWNTFVPSITIAHTPPISDDDFSDAPELRELAERPDYIYDGVGMIFEVRMNHDSQIDVPTYSPEKATVLEKFGGIDNNNHNVTGYRVAWRFAAGVPSLILNAERVQEFVESRAEDGTSGTDYYTWQTFGGSLAPALRDRMGENLKDGFGRWMVGLKDHVEDSSTNWR